MVCYHPPLIDDVRIIDAVHELSSVDPNGAAVQAARALGISFGDSPTDQNPFRFVDGAGIQIQSADAVAEREGALVPEPV